MLSSMISNRIKIYNVSKFFVSVPYSKNFYKGTLNKFFKNSKFSKIPNQYFKEKILILPRVKLSLDIQKFIFF